MKRIKQFFSECQLRIDTFFDGLCDRVTEHVERKEMEQRSFREFVLVDETKNVKLDNKYLQLQLTKTRADLYELQRRPQELRDVISEVLLMTEEQLKDASRFPARKSKTGDSWETVIGFCCLGGCDLDVYSFQSERDALLFSVLLKAVNYQSPHNIACSACYEEYMKDSL